MNWQEVIETLERYRDLFPLDSQAAVDKAIEACKKQIPKKPRASFQSGFFWCPSCERAIKRIIEDSKINISYCPFCGQALNWSDTDG